MPTQAAMPLNSNQKNTLLKPHRVVMFDRRNDTAHKLEKNNQISKSQLSGRDNTDRLELDRPVHLVVQ